jgi:hypothetical protein
VCPLPCNEKGRKGFPFPPGRMVHAYNPSLATVELGNLSLRSSRGKKLRIPYLKKKKKVGHSAHSYNPTDTGVRSRGIVV